MSYNFAPDEGVQEGVLRVAREQLDMAIHPLRVGIDSDSVEAIHTARKAVKKERASLRLVRGALNGRQRSYENEALRTAARALSGARDAEVQLQTLDELRTRRCGPDLLGQDHDLAVLRARLGRLDGVVAADVDELVGAIDYRSGELRDEAVHLGERLYFEKPKQFRRRMRGYWRAGQAQNKAWHDRRPAQLAGLTR